MNDRPARTPQPGETIAVSHWRRNELWLTAGTVAHQGYKVSAVDGRSEINLISDGRHITIPGRTVERIEWVDR